MGGDEAIAVIAREDVHPDSIISHRLKLDDAVRGYAMFERRREALKVVLTP